MDKSILERIEAHSAKLEKMEIEIPEWDLTFYISSITQRVAEKHFTAFAENPIFIRIASNVAKIMGASEEENPDCLGES
jgi:hypothetical protein